MLHRTIRSTSAGLLALWLSTALAPSTAVAAQSPAQESTAKQASQETNTAPAEGTETVVIFRHGEKPGNGLGQLTPQGLNRALAISEVLPQKFGKPDYLFAPDPHQQVTDRGGTFYYVRPLATIEPLAIRLGMPIQTPFGFKDIGQLDDELSNAKYANATVFVAWEHLYARKAAVELVKLFHGDASQIPEWPGKDYDSLYVVRIHRAPGKPTTAIFTLEHEGLDGQSSAMPAPAKK